MKKTAHSLTLLALSGMLAVFFVALPSRADASFVALQQGVLSATSTKSTTGTSYVNAVYLGNGYSASTTGAFLASKAENIVLHSQNFRIDLESFSDPLYATAVGTCTYDSYNRSGDYNGFIQLDHVFQENPGGSCQLLPQYYYKVTTSFVDVGSWGTKIKFMYGANSDIRNRTWTDMTWFPYFTVVADNFFITPTTTDSGVLYSGAVAYCNDAFASSTGVGGYIANGLCIGLGFLFVPTEESVLQFQTYPDVMAQKIPFSYFYNFGAILNGQTASTTSNLTAMSINLRSTGVGSTTSFGNILPTTFSFLSTSTINTYVPTPLYDLLFFLMRSAIWVVVLLHLYRRITPRNTRDV